MEQRIAGASAWEQRVHAHLVEHATAEHDVIRSYAEAASSTRSPAAQYLLRLIIEDEERHHRIFSELAESVLATAQMAPDAPVPSLAGEGDDPDLKAMSEAFSEIERNDLAELRALQRDLHDFEETTLWALLVELMALDTQKHLLILRFLAAHVT